jgi:hypothetical protein
MEEHAYFGGLLTAIFYLIVGIRLFQLASRTRQMPERLLGALFLCSAASSLRWRITSSLVRPEHRLR